MNEPNAETSAEEAFGPKHGRFGVFFRKFLRVFDFVLGTSSQRAAGRLAICSAQQSAVGT